MSCIQGVFGSSSTAAPVARGSKPRRVFRAVCALSLACFVAVCVLWFRSQVTQDFVVYSPRIRPGRSAVLHVETYTGYVRLNLTTIRFPKSATQDFIRRAAGGSPGPVFHRDHARYGSSPPDEPWRVRLGWNFGFIAWQSGTDPRRRIWELEPVTINWSRIDLPFWCVAAILCAAPAFGTLLTLMRRRRARAGRCPECGYDVRASRGRCPECGAQFGT
jgi:hypothetical protein